eukprot:81185_1
MKSRMYEQCKGGGKKEIINGCDGLKRLAEGLKYYTYISITCKNNYSLQDKDDLLEFFINKYTQLLNDFIHFIDNHSNDLERIASELINYHGFSHCNFTNCGATDRYFGRYAKKNDTEIQTYDFEDMVFNFYNETLLSLHYYLFHLFDSGLRLSYKHNDN